jgi:transient-receptor-potential-like protein
MKVWERRLMKDFHVAPVEAAEGETDGEQVETAKGDGEAPLDRFRRISKQVASQSVSIKWNEVIRGATVEANSQIGRCRNRQSFKNQQNLLKAMEQARRLIERSPMPQSPAHSDHYIVDQTNITLVNLLKNISEEINEMSPGNTLHVKTPRNRSVTPLQSLNVQLQNLISASPSPYATKQKPKTRPSSPKPTTLNLRSGSIDGTLSTTTPMVHTPKSPKSRTETPKPPFRVETPKSPLSKPPASILKNRSPTPDSRKSLDDTKSIDSFGSIPVIEISDDRPPSSAPPPIPDSPKLIDFTDNSKDDPLKPNSGSPIKVIKRKAPVPQGSQDISVSRPAVPLIQGQGMIPPPPKEIKPMQIPLLSTTPATPLPSQKPLKTTVAGGAESPISREFDPTVGIGASQLTGTKSSPTRPEDHFAGDVT